MGIIKPVKPVKFFCGLTFQPQIDIARLLTEVEKRFDVIDLTSDTYDFDAFTDYYRPEMGDGLRKLFIAFRTLRPMEELVELKLRSNQFEAEHMKEGSRTFNLDPGYLNLAKVVLATTKDYSHRLYLGKGIYGDLHLVFRAGNYQPQPWTYPDYKQPLAAEFFLQLREIYRDQLQFYLKDLHKNT